MTHQDMTPWFVNGEKPARRGVYNVSCKRERQSGLWFAFWTGSRFLAFTTEAEAAKKFGLEYLHEYADTGAGLKVLTEGSWRGLLYNPV